MSEYRRPVIDALVALACGWRALRRGDGWREAVDAAGFAWRELVPFRRNLDRRWVR